MSKIVAPDPSLYSFFGENFKYNNGQFVIGSPGDKRKGNSAGSFYIYEVANHYARYKKKYFTWDIKAYDYLGDIINLCDTNLYFTLYGLGNRKIYYFILDNFNLRYKYRLLPQSNYSSGYGLEIISFHNRFLVSQPGAGDSMHSWLGNFLEYNFERDSLQAPKMYWGTSKGPDISVGFGSGFAKNDTLLIISAAGESDSIYYMRGCIYIYSIMPDTFLFREKVCAPFGQNYQFFGSSLAISGARLYVGAPQRMPYSDQGRVFVYDITGDSLKLTHILTSPGSSNYNEFGYQIAALGDSLLVSSPRDTLFGWERGAAFLFSFDNENNIKLERSIGLPDSARMAYFPSAIVLTKEFILAGDPGADSGRGAVYMYSLSPPTEVKQEPFFEGDFLLEQNYPNPFNPVTSIKYSLRTGGEISLIIYDCLGVKVRTLVNEFQYPGDYEVELNAAGLASGVYLYKLQAGNFVQTKKLLLLK